MLHLLQNHSNSKNVYFSIVGWVGININFLKMPLIGQEAERLSADCYPLTDVGVAV
jgi:hypothetical protein